MTNAAPFVRAWIAALAIAEAVIAQQVSAFSGDFSGGLNFQQNVYHVRLHLTQKPDGSLSGTMDSVEQYVSGMPLADIRISGNSLSFSIPFVHAGWAGFLSADGKTLSGTYNQGVTLPLEMKRVGANSTEVSPGNTPAPAPPASPSPTPASPPTQLPSQFDVSEYKYGDYTFKLMGNGETGEIFEGMRAVGTVYTVNGKQEVMPSVAEPEASKIKKAFVDWQASGKAGSTAPPQQPVSYESDGSAVVPMQDGTIVTFRPTYIEVNQPSALAVLPGQAPVSSVKFLLHGPNFGKQLFGSHTGIYLNGKELKDWTAFNNGGRGSVKIMYYRLQPLLEGPVTKAADLASTAPNKPANALEYKGPIPELLKRVAGQPKGTSTY